MGRFPTTAARFGQPMYSQFLWASGARSGDDDPFLGKGILSQFRDRNALPIGWRSSDALP